MFQLRPITAEDIPYLVDLWHLAFTGPINERLFPDTPGLRAWGEHFHRSSLTGPNQRYLKIISDAESAPPFVAFVKWDLDTASPNPEHRFPPWHADSDRDFCDHFFRAMDQARKTIMRGRKHYYLDTLATHPDYQRKGAASMLIQWGCEVADREGMPIWVDASEDGAALYKRFGFQDVSVPGVTPEGASSMLREPVRRDTS
ncbi:acyl-CoA N-acyltransferase [Aspergillus heteromorphus CBS 117.55]|uniref:Acyl-CoA N-acyltransferase n=1 Tax=Aspergillus heteromorphus CBS 117.55 TaxID=1448321 RepID=A0A317V4L8_9EURO|nr:acyl-CoA N-acyltransferase [Aspergillus heteromorphus CBS 117.55]PWY69045.1 acyl-CoA N-acyltransferase [Aspergillus heteromorphus CBS 117.55]